MSISYKILVAMLVVAFTITSCVCPPAKPVQKQPVAKKAATPEAPIEDTGCCDVCHLVKLTASAPKEAILGQEYMSTVDLLCLQNAGEVQLMTRVPANLQYVRSEPPAEVQGNKLIWDLQSMNKGDKRQVKVYVRANQEGVQWLCYTLSALPRYCVDTLIGSAKLAIRKEGPATAQLNGTVTYTVVVENTGTATATGVVVNDQLPQGLVATSPVSFQVGDLAPKATKSFQVVAKANERGSFCNVATVTSSNAGQAQAQACTKVVKNDLEPNITCTKEAFVGQNGEINFAIANTGDVPLTNVRANIEYPAGVRVVSSDCQPMWNIGTLNPGAQASAKTVVTGQAEGQHCVRITVTSAEGLSKTATCCTQWKGMAKLQITKSAPATAQVGETFNYTIEVKNVGTGLAREVVCVDTLPPQVSHPRGREIRETVGDLAPGQSRVFTIPVRAEQTGNACNIAKAISANAEQVQAEACTTIQKMAADLVVKCPDIRFVNQPQITEIVFANVGGVALTNIVITASWSANVQVRGTEPQAVITGQQAVWTIPTLNAGQQKVVTLKTMCIAVGKECIQVMAQTAQGLSKQANCCTEWKGQPALLLEVIDTVDPLSPGEDTTYVIEVTNQGTADDQNVQIIANFPPEIDPVKIGPDVPGTIQGKRVVFQIVPILKPKAKIKHSIVAKGVSVGDARLRVELTSELLKKAVNEEESTHVY